MLKFKKSERQEFVDGYIDALLFCGVMGPEGEEAFFVNDADRDNLAPSTVIRLTRDALEFLECNANDILEASKSWSLNDLGHDFYLTRCGHGTGFWDRGLGEVGDRLSEASGAYGECLAFEACDGDGLPGYPCTPGLYYLM